MKNQRSTGERRRAAKFMREAFWRQKGRCLDCGIFMTVGDHPALGSTATIEHLVPRAAGGKASRRNIAATCWNCNQARNLQQQNPQAARALIEMETRL